MRPRPEVLLTGASMGPLEMVDLAVRAEAAGLVGAWVTEGWWDAVTPLAMMADRTKHIRIGAACSLVNRPPDVAQLTFAAIDHVAEGRLSLGIASGPSTARTRSTALRLREWIAAFRTFEAIKPGASDCYNGELYHYEEVRRFTATWRDRLPLIVGAAGPAGLKVAGEVGDGWVGPALTSAAYLNEWVSPRLSQSLDRSGDGTFERLTVRLCSVHPDIDEARRRIRPQLAHYLMATHFADLVKFHGYGRLVEKLRLLQDASGLAAAASALPIEAIDNFALCATTSTAADVLAAQNLPVDTVLLCPPALGLEGDVIANSYSNLLKAFSQ